jgi:SAM-dependent methyltransferase
MFRTLQNCRLCDGEFFDLTLKMKDTPIANELYSSYKEARTAEKFPLEVVMCRDCRHIQLKHIVNAHRLFDDYVYRSGTSNFFKDHFRNLAGNISKNFKINSYVLEIGCNDGELLKSLKSKGIRSIGIEPSKILANYCNSIGLEVFNSYLNLESVRKLIEIHGKASLVIGNNVFAHIDDIQQAFQSVNMVLNEDGIFIFEVAHFKHILTDGIFDTIYHEHMSYHTVFAMEKFALKSGFKVINVEIINSHGGSLRFYLSKNLKSAVNSSVTKLIADENSLGLNSGEVLTRIECNINSLKINVHKFFSGLQNISEIRLFGYGAPAKIITFLYQMELENLNLIGVIDDNPSKQGKYLPGCGFSIFSNEYLKFLILKEDPSRAQYMYLIFPWNLSEEIIRKLTSLSIKNASAVVFLPNLKEVRI